MLAHLSEDEALIRMDLREMLESVERAFTAGEGGMPPMRLSRSRMVTSRPCFARVSPATNPESPAPTIVVSAIFNNPLDL